MHSVVQGYTETPSWFTVSSETLENNRMKLKTHSKLLIHDIFAVPEHTYELGYMNANKLMLLFEYFSPQNFSLRIFLHQSCKWQINSLFRAYGFTKLFDSPLPALSVKACTGFYPLICHRQFWQNVFAIFFFAFSCSFFGLLTFFFFF